ncbi:helix-turn-helix transcriptional regulator [Propionivibrio sp.]|uniref:helix-turn-helix transcriptional regulator n=1 Tax=Propionivibrio sp. TaxID=2212460 RepID=UPI003BF1BB71
MAIDKYLRIKQVCELTGLSRATIYAMEKKGDFPSKKALGPRAVAWLESEIATWMESRKSAVKSGREAKPGRPSVRKSGSPRKAEKSAIEPTEQPSLTPPVGASGIVTEPTDDFPGWSEEVSETTDKFADWSDGDDVPKSPNQPPRLAQAPSKRNARKEGAVRINRGVKAIDVVADFNASRLGKAKPSK